MLVGAALTEDQAVPAPVYSPETVQTCILAQSNRIPHDCHVQTSKRSSSRWSQYMVLIMVLTAACISVTVDLLNCSGDWKCWLMHAYVHGSGAHVCSCSLKLLQKTCHAKDISAAA